MKVQNGKWSLMVLALTLAGLAGCDRGEQKSASAAQPAVVPVTVASVVEKDVPVSLHAIGNVESIESVSIKSQMTGQITEVHFKEGQDVKKGELLFTIDPRPAKADLDRAEGTLLKDQAQAKNSRVQAERYAKLMQEGVVAKQQYDQFVAEAESGEATVAADKAAVENARLQLQYTRIYSPVTGRTGNLAVKLGNIVKANEVPALVSINQISPIYVTFSVPEQQLSDVKRYMQQGSLHVVATRQGAKAEEVAQGKLTFIDNSVDSTTGTIKMKAEFANADRKLWPGQFADVTLTLTTEPKAIVVPSQAVQTGQQGQYVFVIAPDMTADMRMVSVKRTVGAESVVQTGLKAGEKVVIDGMLRLTKGARVEIKQAATEQTQAPSVAAD